MFRKPTRPSLPLKKAFFESLRLPLDKISCTRQFESKLSLRSFAKSLAKGSSTSNQAFLLRRKDVTALRCSEPLRYKVGGPKPSPCFARWDRLGMNYYRKATSQLQRRHYSLSISHSLLFQSPTSLITAPKS